MSLVIIQLQMCSDFDLQNNVNKIMKLWSFYQLHDSL